FYFGSASAEAAFDVMGNYPGVGAVGANTGPLTLGNLNSPRRPSFPHPIFKGLMAAVPIYDTVLDLSQILQVQHGQELTGDAGDLAPRITQIKFLEDGQVYLQIAGRVAQTYRILAGNTPSAEA